MVNHRAKSGRALKCPVSAPMGLWLNSPDVYVRARKSRKAHRFCAQNRTSHSPTGMRRTFFNGTMPIDKHFAHRRENTHRFGAMHLFRPLNDKASPDADISKGSPILRSKRVIPSPTRMWASQQNHHAGIRTRRA